MWSGANAWAGEGKGSGAHPPSIPTLVHTYLLGLATLDQIVGALLLVSGDEVSVVHT